MIQVKEGESLCTKVPLWVKRDADVEIKTSGWEKNVTKDDALSNNNVDLVRSGDSCSFPSLKNNYKGRNLIFKLISDELFLKQKFMAFQVGERQIEK